LNNDVVAGQDSLYASAVIDTTTKVLIIKMVNASDKEKSNTIELQGVKKMAKEASHIVLQSNDLSQVNSFDSPGNIAPKETTIAIKGKKINVTVAPYSFNVIRVKLL
jgi:alpha-L-arabinofuranosidase